MAGEQNKYAALDQWSTEQLEELLRADAASLDSGTEGVISHILEVMEQRERASPTGRLADVPAAWEEFQRYYNIPEGGGQALYPCEADRESAGRAPVEKVGGPVRRRRPRRIWRGGLVAAAAMAALLCGMVAAQAAGVDVFGALGRWTDETFHFAAAGSSEASAREVDAGYYEQIQSVLCEWGAEEDLFPTWQPDGFAASEPYITHDSRSNTISVDFVGPEAFYMVCVTYYRSPPVSLGTFEKDDGPVEEYLSNGRRFYIFSNMDTVTAAWYHDQYMIMIGGNLTRSDLTMVIDSIGGN